MKIPLVSIIISTRNEANHIETLLKSIQAQSFKEIEVILVDNYSTDDTLFLAQKYTPYIYTQGPERSAQRNFGVAQCKAEFVFILDADMNLTSHVVEACIAIMESSPKTGGIIVPEVSYGEGFWTQCKALERSCYIGEDTIEAARFFRREAFLAVGGYDETLNGPEDWDLHDRVKRLFEIKRIQELIGHNEGKLTLKSLMRKKRYYAQDGVKYIRKHSKKLLNIQTIYFFRPAFIKNWRKLLKQPILSIGVFIMLTCELCAAIVGSIEGRKSAEKFR